MILMIFEVISIMIVIIGCRVPETLYQSKNWVVIYIEVLQDLYSRDNLASLRNIY